jgi:hypothetical protein
MATPIALDDLTSSLVDGEGVFDVLMRANKAHLEQEFTKNRIKGPEYAQVYLGSLQTVLATALQFVMQKEAANQDMLLKEKQIELATAQIAQAAAQTLQVEAQTLLITQQRANLTAEALNIPKQGALLDAQVLVATKQVDIAAAEILIKQQQVLVAQAEVAIAEAKLVNIPKEGAQLDAQTLLIGQQRANLTAEALNIPKQGLLIDANKDQVTQQTENLVEQGLLITEQVESEAFRNFVHPTDPTLSGTLEKERQVLIAQECKLKAEFDVLILTKDKTVSETTLLGQKLATEKAQVLAIGVDADSLVGRQKALYQGQTNGFLRDAEQKAAKLLVDTWSVRRTTNDTTPADATNKLNDATIGQVVTKLLTGVGA